MEPGATELPPRLARQLLDEGGPRPTAVMTSVLERRGLAQVLEEIQRKAAQLGPQFSVGQGGGWQHREQHDQQQQQGSAAGGQRPRSRRQAEPLAADEIFTNQVLLRRL